MGKRYLKKAMAVILAAVLLVGCSGKKAEDKTETPVATEGPIAGKKIAVVRNLAAGDHTQQFLDGCVSEGKKFGFTVDTYVTDGDDAKLQETVAQVITKNYDGLIVSHGQLSYSYDMLKPAVDKGMKVVTFDTMPMKDGDAKGELLETVTSTAQADHDLATLSLDEMIKEHEEKGGELPVKVLKTFMGPGIPPLDRRNEVYQKYEEEGKIKTIQTISPSDAANVRGDMTQKTEAILPTIKEGDIDAIWGCYDELAKGVLQALNDSNRKDIPMYTIDISNDDIQLMLENSEVWKSAAAVDPKLIGVVDMRLMALKLADKETPEYFNLGAQNVLTTQLKEGVTMQDLGELIEGWGNAEDPEGSFYTEELKELYAK